MTDVRTGVFSPNWRRRRALLGGVIFVLAVATLAWPWGILPLRWRYSNIRAAERVIRTIDDFQRQYGRYPSIDEVNFGIEEFGYEARTDGYRVTVTEGFDLYYVYDSRDRIWKRFGSIPEK